MRKLFFFAVMLLFAATACESEVNNTDNSGATDSRVTEDVMDMLINDLLKEQRHEESLSRYSNTTKRTTLAVRSKPI